MADGNKNYNININVNSDKAVSSLDNIITQADRLASSLDNASKVLALQKQGYWDKDIATALGVSLSTVKGTLAHMRDREDRTTTQLALRADDQQFLDDDFITGINSFRRGKWRG